MEVFEGAEWGNGGHGRYTSITTK